MDTDQIVAIIGGLVVAFVIRVFNVVVEWLSRVLGVAPPDPIPTAHDALSIDHTAPTVISSQPEAPDTSE